MKASAFRPDRWPSEVPPEVDDEQADRAVEHPLGARRPRLDLAAAEVAPEEVRDHRDRDQERDSKQDTRGRERRLLVQDHDRERDERKDREIADEWVDPVHAVMYARTPRAAATRVAPLNQASRARGSAGA